MTQLELDLESNTLTVLERRIYRCLKAAEGPVPKEDILKVVWGIDFNTGANRVEVAIRRMRMKGIPIITHRGYGYSL